MTDLTKFEKMLELLVNEDKVAAQELFHEIVVEKSRDIYESLLEDDEEVDEASDEDEDDEEVDEASDEEVDESDEDLDENFSLDTFEVEADEEEVDMDDEEEVDMDDEEGEDEGDVEDRVEDLEDALDDLKAEFEKMMAGEEGEEKDDEDGDMGGDQTDDMMSDLGMDTDESTDEDESFQATVTPMESKVAKSAGEQMREYVEKVSATMGDNGVNTTSTLAKPNNMGGTTANIAKGGTADTKGTAGGLASNKPQVMNTKNVNVVGAKGATKMSSQPGHGAEKKGKPETAANTKSTVGK
jgi:hypothetical protein